jgi:hypothetical protein
MGLSGARAKLLSGTRRKGLSARCSDSGESTGLKGAGVVVKGAGVKGAGVVVKEARDKGAGVAVKRAGVAGKNSNAGSRSGSFTGRTNETT